LHHRITAAKSLWQNFCALLFAPLRDDQFSRKGAKTPSKTRKAEGFATRSQYALIAEQTGNVFS
jgi:hypothetical protein